MTSPKLESPAPRAPTPDGSAVQVDRLSEDLAPGPEAAAGPTEGAAPGSNDAPSPQGTEEQRPWGRGVALTLAGALPPFLMAASDRHYGAVGVVVGSAGCLVAAAGLMQLLRAFGEPDEQVEVRTSVGVLAPRLMETVASVALFVAVARLAVAGRLPWPVATAALLVPATFIGCVVSVFRLGRALGAWQSTERALWQREGFWLTLIASLLYLPMLGSFSLIDPWETHYGEVAREMLARDDWISLWWAQDGWFWSKPVLDFWLQGLSFSLLGVRFAPDQMLSSVSSGAFPQPEWAARLPIFLITLGSVYVLYKAVATAYGRRAGLLGGLVLLCVPYWYFLARQTMTDMPYVAPFAAAMGLFFLGFETPRERRCPAVEIRVGKRTLRLSAYHLVMALVALCVIPQILYLASRNLTLHTSPLGLSGLHADGFFSGSGGGNCGLPGNEVCQRQSPLNPELQPLYAAGIWTGLLALLFTITRNERRVRALYFLGAWLCVALSAMAKGAPGLVLPLFILALYVVVTRRYKDVQDLQIGSAVLIFACLVLPWYVQMYMRHGQGFTDRLLFHDMYKRAFVHVHDTNSGDDTSFRYYIWQLGYGLFPFTGLAAGGLLWWLKRPHESQDGQTGLLALLGLWFVSAFAMFTVSLTKFHHYVLPAVPPLALLAGIVLDRFLGRLPAGRQLLGYLAGIGAGTALLTAGLVVSLPGALDGAATERVGPPGAPLLGGSLALAGAAAIALAARRFGRRMEPDPSAGGVDPYERVLLGVLALSSAILLLLVGRDLFSTVRGDVSGQARLMHLFTYNYARPWPHSLDFRGVLKAFTAVAVLACLGMAVGRWRRGAGVLLCATGVLWAGWGVNVYLTRAAPHWGQRETVLAYYERRAGPEEPLVAYQMNWKGENFYTGNRVPAFVQSGDKFKSFVSERKARGVKVMFFTTEHGRLNGLKRELGDVQQFDVITTPELNNKFLLARVVL